MQKRYVPHLKHKATLKICEAKSSLRSSLVWHLRGMTFEAKKRRAVDITKCLFFFYFFVVDTPTFSFRNSSLTSTKNLAWASLKASNMVIQIFQIRLSLEATKNIFINSLAVLAFWRLLRYEKKGAGITILSTIWEKKKKKKNPHPRFRCTYELCWMNSWPSLWGIL